MNMITSKENNFIKLYQKLSSGRKYRTEYGKFTLEGMRLIQDAINENAELHCVFVTQGFVDRQSQHGDALDFLSEDALRKTSVITDELGAKLASTDGTQGIFAICSELENPRLSDTVRKGGKYLLLHSIQDPGNMGTIIRTADAMGVDAVITVGCCDIYNPKVIRSTMGSIFRITVCDTDIDSAFDAFGKCGITSFGAVIDADSISLTDCCFCGGAAVLIGNEGNGLPADIVKKCDKKLTIKMQGNVNSLNAAMASGIIMWELTKK